MVQSSMKAPPNIFRKPETMTNKPSSPFTPKQATSDFVQQQMKDNKFVINKPSSQVPVAPVVKTFDPSSAPTTPIGNVQQAFNPVSPKAIAETGASSHRVVNLLSTFDSSTGILDFGKDVMATISAKSDEMLKEVKDADVDFVETQMRSILTMAKSLHLPKAGDHSKDGGGWLTGLVAKVKENFVDTKEQLLSEFNNVSTQMDRVIGEVDHANRRIIDKVKGLQTMYQSNLQDYKNLDQLIKDATEAYNIKVAEYDKLQSQVTDALQAQSLQRMGSNLDRLDKKIANMKSFQLMCLQDAPNLAQMEDNAVTLLEKFDTIKTMTIPLWKKQIRMFIDGQELNRAAKLASAVDDANNAMISANSTANKQNAIETTRLNQRGIVDMQTAEQVHENLLATLEEVSNINAAGRKQRIESSDRMDEMKRLYASIASGQMTVSDARGKMLPASQN
jgi:uncharacterized protein YaaN involved in tellurite resistance